MKKILIILAILIIMLSTLKASAITIPKSSIRFRVIANSNNKKDQQVKKEIITSLSTQIANIENNSTNIINSREKIKKSIPELKYVVNKTIADLNYKNEYSINYGMNYFPEKVYKGVTYPEGEYESLVITLGEGLGENFWCVLFPPLCLLETEENDKDEVEYSSLVQEIIDKYF